MDEERNRYRPSTGQASTTSRHVWLFQSGEPLPGLAGARRMMRAGNLSRSLLEHGHRVTLWTADFDHFERLHHFSDHVKLHMGPKFEIRLISSSGYKRNVGLGRLFDHAQLAYELSRRLKSEREVPDVAFLGFPPIEPVAVMARWLKLRNVPYFVDAKDMWPDIMMDVLPSLLKPAARGALSPYQLLARAAMSQAKGLLAPSAELLDWSLRKTGRARSSTDGVFPTVPPPRDYPEAQLDEARRHWDSLGVVDNHAPRIVFVGSFTTGFDFNALLSIADSEVGRRFEFVMAGSGPERDQLQRCWNRLPNVLFPGWIDGPQVAILSERATVAVAPYRSDRVDFASNVPNKVLDALSHGLPVLTSASGATKELLQANEAGLYWDSEDPRSLEKQLQYLLRNEQALQRMRSNAAALYERDFGFHRVYGRLTSHLVDACKPRVATAVRSDDHEKERNRYDSAARSVSLTPLGPSGAEAVPVELREPYTWLESQVRDLVDPDSQVLELGAGTGLHTVCLSEASSQVTALDISKQALRVCRERTRGRASVVEANIEDLPFPDGSFDVVVSVGSLSYGEANLVDSEMLRVLRPGGSVIIVDSLNGNPLYRANRFIHWLRGERTRSTLRNMPSLKRLRRLANRFGQAELVGFGTWQWLPDVVYARLSPATRGTSGLALHGAFKIAMVGQDLQPIIDHPAVQLEPSPELDLTRAQAQRRIPTPACPA